MRSISLLHVAQSPYELTSFRGNPHSRTAASAGRDTLATYDRNQRRSQTLYKPHLLGQSVFEGLRIPVVPVVQSAPLGLGGLFSTPFAGMPLFFSRACLVGPSFASSGASPLWHASHASVVCAEPLHALPFRLILSRTHWAASRGLRATLRS